MGIMMVLIILGTLVVVVLLVMIIAAVARHVDKGGDYYTPPMPDAKHPILPPMPYVGNPGMRTLANRRRQPGTQTQMVPKVTVSKSTPVNRSANQPAALRSGAAPAGPNWAPPTPPAPPIPRNTPAPPSPSSSGPVPGQQLRIPPQVLADNARRLGDVGINFDAAKMILLVFTRLDKQAELPPIIVRELDKIGMSREHVRELQEISEAVKDEAIMDFNALRTMSRDKAEVIYNSMKQVWSGCE